jgi:hypothetical protein
MIFTVGRAATYVRLLLDPQYHLPKFGGPVKLGRTVGYQGGSVWETERAAEEWLRANKLQDEYLVFPVDADWDLDTAKSLGCDDSFRDLTRDATILRPNWMTPAPGTVSCPADVLARHS